MSLRRRHRRNRGVGISKKLLKQTLRPAHTQPHRELRVLCKNAKTSSGTHAKSTYCIRGVRNDSFTREMVKRQRRRVREEGEKNYKLPGGGVAIFDCGGGYKSRGHPNRSTWERYY